MSTESHHRVPGQSPPVGLSDYLGIFSRRIWYIVIPFVAVVLIAGALGFMLPQEYQQYVRVKVLDQGFNDVFYKRVAFDVPHKPFLTTINEDILNRGFLEPLIRRHNVNEGYSIDDPREFQLLLTKIVRNVKVRLIPQQVGPDIIGISYRGRNAKTVGHFVHGIYTAYSENLTERYRQTIVQGRDDLEKQYQSALSEFEVTDQEWKDFQLTDDYRLIGVDYQARRSDLARTKNTLRDKKRELSAQERIFEEVRSELRKTDEFVEKTRKERNPDYARQQDLIRELEEELEGLRKKFTEQWPAVREARTRLDTERAKLAQIQDFVPTQKENEQNPKYVDLDTRKTELEAGIQGLRAEIAGLNEEIAQIEVDVERIPAITSKADILENNRQSALAMLERISREREKAQSTWHRITGGAQSGFFQLLSAPKLDEYDAWEPVFPNVGLFVGIGAFVGLLLGCGIAFLVEFTSQSFVTVSQVRRTLPLPVLGRVAAIETVRERRRRIRRRVIVAVVVLVIVAVLIYAHVCYFTRSLQHHLPTGLFDLMKRFYGIR